MNITKSCLNGSRLFDEHCVEIGPLWVYFGKYHSDHKSHLYSVREEDWLDGEIDTDRCFRTPENAAQYVEACVRKYAGLIIEALDNNKKESKQ